MLPGGSDGQDSACDVGDPGSIPRSKRSPGEGNGNPLQYSYLENPTDRGAGAPRMVWVLKEDGFSLMGRKIKVERQN